MNAPGLRMSLSALLEGMALTKLDLMVDGLAVDSRRIRPGELFLALPGTNTNGLQHAPDAVRRGAVAVAYDAAMGPESLPDLGVPMVAVHGLREAAGVMADRFYGHPSHDLRVIGVTGTNGKTSVAYFLAQALSEPGHPGGLIGTLGYGPINALQAATHTTPDVITIHRQLAAMREAGVRYVAMEVSSHGLDQQRVAGVRFDTAVFTNLTHEHLDYHGDLQSYGQAKRRLFDLPGVQAGVINMDDVFGRELMHECIQQQDVWAYGLGEVPWQAHEAQQVVGRQLQLSHEGLAMTVETAEGQAQLRSGLFGAFNASNLLATLAVLLKLGMPLAMAVERLARVQPPPGRMERFGAEGRPLVVVDYAHTPDALEQVLGALRGHCPGKLWCVFGCGGDRDQEKRPLMGQVAEAHADELVITDDNPRHEDGDMIVAQILSGLDEADRVHIQRDRTAAIRQTLQAAAPDDVVLVAGKGHEDYQQVGDEYRPYSDRETVMALLREGAQ